MTSTVTSHYLQPQQGFHSTLSTTFVLDPPDPGCSFFALYTFPQTVIIDRHELMNHRLSFEFWGESNLELPVFALDQTARSLLLINATASGSHPEQVVVDIPVHARYGEPSMHPLVITLPSPTSFWGCPPSAIVSSTVFSSEPPVADSTWLSSLAYFSVPSASSHVASLQIPVASKRDLFSVEIETTTIILMAFLWLVNRSWKVATTLQSCHLKEQ